jgi:hypothetical protein
VSVGFSKVIVTPSTSSDSGCSRSVFFSVSSAVSVPGSSVSVAISVSASSSSSGSGSGSGVMSSIEAISSVETRLPFALEDF